MFPPGVLVSNPEQAWATWVGWGPDPLFQALMASEEVPPGFTDPRQATRRLAAHLLEHLPPVPGVRAFVTHDLILGTFVARALGRVPRGENWPGFLHAALLWKEGPRLVLAYREWTAELP